MKPGDVFLNNYPYWSSAHTLDPLVFAPIHVDDELIGFSSCRVHVLDLMAKDMGYVLDSTDMFQEGIFFPAVRLYREGIINDDIFNIVKFNSRLPSHTIGDIQAEVSAVVTGVRRAQELSTKFGVDTVCAAMEAINDHGERLARAALQAHAQGLVERRRLRRPRRRRPRPAGEDRRHRHGDRRRDDRRLDRQRRRRQGSDQPAQGDDRSVQLPRVQGVDDAGLAGHRRQLPPIADHHQGRIGDARRAPDADVHAVDRPARRGGDAQGARRGHARSRPGLFGWRRLLGDGLRHQPAHRWPVAGSDERCRRLRRPCRRRR